MPLAWPARAAFATLMVDVDGMKAMNDTQGHQMGDSALVALTEALQREDAIVGRYGGDEFLVLLPGALREDAEAYCDAVQEALVDLHLTAPNSNEPYSFTVSFGMSIFPVDAISARGLIKQADDAMYASRYDGKPERATGAQAA